MEPINLVIKYQFQAQVNLLWILCVGNGAQADVLQQNGFTTWVMLRQIVSFPFKLHTLIQIILLGHLNQ